MRDISRLNVQWHRGIIRLHAIAEIATETAGVVELLEPALVVEQRTDFNIPEQHELRDHGNFTRRQRVPEKDLRTHGDLARRAASHLRLAGTVDARNDAVVVEIIERVRLVPITAQRIAFRVPLDADQNRRNRITVRQHPNVDEAVPVGGTHDRQVELGAFGIEDAAIDLNLDTTVAGFAEIIELRYRQPERGRKRARDKQVFRCL